MNNPKISLIAAISSKDRGIGFQGRIPWYIKGEQAHFKQMTIHHVIIMGRKTIESGPMRRTLPDRINIVITREQNYVFEDAIICHSVNEALEKAKEILRSAQARRDDSLKKDEIFIIGGAELFSQTINKADRLYLTLVEGDYQSDAFFPDYSGFTHEVAREDHEQDGIKFRYVVLEKNEAEN